MSEATYDLTEDADSLASDTTTEKPKRAVMIRGWVDGNKIEFHQGGQKIEEFNLSEFSSDLLSRYALEGIARTFMLGSERHEVLDGSGLPKREKIGSVAKAPVDREREKLLAKLAKAEAGARELKAMLDAKGLTA